MGHFSNGAMGSNYEEQYCRKCIHYGPEDGPGCPIWGMHLAYSGTKNPELGIVMNIFIEELEEPPWNGECRMFTESKQIALESWHEPGREG